MCVSLDRSHREKMDALSEIIRLQKESNKRDIIVFILSVSTSFVISLIMRFL